MGPEIVIENNTVWPTRLLKPFVTRIAREEFPGTKFSNTRRKVNLEIRYTRGGGRGCSGYAYYNSSRALVRVPHPKHGKFPLLDFCHVVGHEFGHCKGLTHAQMGLHYGRSCRRGTYTGTHYAWALTLREPVMPVKVTPVKPTKDDVRAVKIKAAEDAVARWTRKQKLATTKLTHWTRKLGALERAAAKVNDVTAVVLVY